MPKEQLRYDKMVEAALRGVVRDALTQVATRGLPGNHHFYITFRTGYPGVRLPDYLRSQYPGEMTIVLQYQFFGLELDDERLSVTLSFNNVHERLVVPFAAITTFSDPSVSFTLQFTPLSAPEPALPAEVVEAPTRSSAKSAEPGEEKRGEVVALDAFRKK